MNIRLTIITILAVCAAVWVMPEASGTIFVTNTADSGPGSLRQAIISANLTTGATIGFGIPGTDANCNSTTNVCTITPQTVLPTITSTVTIDGYTQPGTSANTLAAGDNAVIRIVINGATVDPPNGNLLSGLQIAASNCLVRGLDINTFYTQILISSGSGNIIAGNFLGTDARGTTVPGSGIEGNIGVNVQSPNNTIGGTTAAVRNLIGASGNGIEIGGPGTGATGTLIQGNFIGTDHTGTAGLGVGNMGIFDNGVNSITIGGVVSGARNVIAQGGTLRGTASLSPAAIAKFRATSSARM
jgi:hypothetical protein